MNAKEKNHQNKKRKNEKQTEGNNFEQARKFGETSIALHAFTIHKVLIINVMVIDNISTFQDVCLFKR